MDTIILSIRVAFETPKVCKIVAFLVVIMCLGRLFYILWGLDSLFFSAFGVYDIGFADYGSLNPKPKP